MMWTGDPSVDFVSQSLINTGLDPSLVLALDIGTDLIVGGIARSQALLDGSLPNLAKTTSGPTLGQAPRGGLIDTLIGNMPDRVKWIRNGGCVITHTDGSTTYVKNGISIVYNSKGFPDFSRFLYKGTDGLSEVRIALTGTRSGDFAAATGQLVSHELHGDIPGITTRIQV